MRRLRFHRGSIIACAIFTTTVASAISRGNIFVTYGYPSQVVGEFTDSGQVINSDLISGVAGSIAISGSNIYVVQNFGMGFGIGEFTTDGNIINGDLIPGVSGKIAISGSNLFVGNGGTISEYTTSGVPVNISLINGLQAPDFAVSGSNIFVVIPSSGTVAEYSTSGTLLNADLISGLGNPQCIAVSGSDLFISAYPPNYGGDNPAVVSEYTTSGVLVNASLFTTSGATLAGIAFSGSDIFTCDYGHNAIGEYTGSGSTVNDQLISLIEPTSFAIADVPEPASLSLLLLGGVSLLHRRRRH